jgi:riboflavin synthase alpha subunit
VFTGLIREVGRIEGLASRASITTLRIAAPLTASGLAVGDSLAVNGICLTVTALAGDRVDVEATVETRRVTTLATWAAGDHVHLEPSLRAGDPIGGHFVLGHVDGVGRVANLHRRGGAAVLRVTLPAALAWPLVPKGSIAVDGVSLTLDEGPFRDGCSITLVPHTLAVTRLGRLRPGDVVNVELDMLAKAARTLAESRRPTTLASIRARGWQRVPRG